MIISGNPYLQGGKGKINDLVVRQVGGKTVVSKVPDMSRRKLSEKQKQANHLMAEAIANAQHITGNPKIKAEFCELLDVPPNKVFRAIVKEYITSKGKSKLFDDPAKHTEENNSVKTIRAAIIEAVPDAELKLFGARAANYGNANTDWDILILTDKSYPNSTKWALQEKLFEIITASSGARVNIILAQKDDWNNSSGFTLLKERVGETISI